MDAKIMAVGNGEGERDRERESEMESERERERVRRKSPVLLVPLGKINNSTML